VEEVLGGEELGEFGEAGLGLLAVVHEDVVFVVEERHAFLAEVVHFAEFLLFFLAQSPSLHSVVLIVLLLH
jgi:hypothetical protein